MKIRSYAKINLHLEVLGRLPDGFHQLRTVFQSVDLADDLELHLGGSPGVRLDVVGGDLSAGPGNLAWEAAEAFRRRWAPELGIDLRLAKHIPIGGGLGGGSSNAATVLMALQRQTGRADEDGLQALARELGADVPFFLTGGTALGLGRGDEIVPLTDLPTRELWLVLPGFSVPTSRVFAALSELTPDSVDPRIVALAQGGGIGWEVALLGRNDLQGVACDLYPLLKDVRDALEGAGASVARLSGSGSTFFALFDQRPVEERLREALPANSRVLTVQSISRGHALGLLE